MPRCGVVGCAIVYPQFVTTCHSYLETVDSADIAEYDAFEQQCLNQDALALVE